jgi:inner membrane protein
MFQALLNSRPSVVALIFLALMLPLSWVSDLIDERQAFREAAVADVSESWTGPQTLVGPVVVVRYRVHGTRSEWNDQLGRSVDRPVTTTRCAFLALAEVAVDGDVRTELRYRGLHGVPVYTASLAVSGRWSPEALPGLLREGAANLEVDDAYLWFWAADQRGFADFPNVRWGGEALAAEPGGHGALGGTGVRVSLTLDALRQEADLTAALTLRGASSLGMLPAGETARVDLTSDWAHPRFTGRFLPESRDIGAGGFGARWRNTVLASNVVRELARCAGGQCDAVRAGHFSVELVEPVNEYSLAERAVKYALLFILIVFCGVLFTELARALEVHPLQYGLIGAAMAVFYLLLLALSEHLPFGLAYAIAAMLCAALLAWYGAAVLRSPRDGALLGAGVATLYGLLYLILQAEDVALLMGTGLVFVVLAGLMAVTRDPERLAAFRLARRSEEA